MSTDNEKSELCRSCLKNCDGSLTLNRTVSFNPTKLSEHVQIPFVDIYNVCTNLEAKIEDQFTQCFCNECFDNILKAYQTIKTAQESHNILWRVVNSIKGPCEAVQEPYSFKNQKPQEKEVVTQTVTTKSNNYNGKVKCPICKDLVPRQYEEFHRKKYHSDRSTSTKHIHDSQSASTSSTTEVVNEALEGVLELKTEHFETIEFDPTMTTEDKIYSFLEELKADMELVKSRVFNSKLDYNPEISYIDNSIFPLTNIEDLEATNAKLEDDPLFKKELQHRFKSMGGKTEIDFFRNIARNIYSDELLNEVTWEGTQVKRKFSSFGNLIYLQIAAINSSDESFNATWNMAKEFYKGYLKNAPARLKKKIEYAATDKNRQSGAF